MVNVTRVAMIKQLSSALSVVHHHHWLLPDTANWATILHGMRSHDEY